MADESQPSQSLIQALLGQFRAKGQEMANMTGGDQARQFGLGALSSLAGLRGPTPAAPPASRLAQELASQRVRALAREDGVQWAKFPDATSMYPGARPMTPEQVQVYLGRRPANMNRMGIVSE